MDKKIVEFLKSYEISNSEIEDLKNIAPMLEVASFQEWIENCATLIKYGYPEEDLDVLIMSNPNMFVDSSQDLDEDLKQLKIKYGDIETILKENPYILNEI